MRRKAPKHSEKVPHIQYVPHCQDEPRISLLMCLEVPRCITYPTPGVHIPGLSKCPQRPVEKAPISRKPRSAGHSCLPVCSITRSANPKRRTRPSHLKVGLNIYAASSQPITRKHAMFLIRTQSACRHAHTTHACPCLHLMRRPFLYTG